MLSDLFTINGDLTVQGGALLRVDKTGGTTSQDQVLVNGGVNYGGVLTINNITSDATALVVGDSFPVFNASGSKLGNFASIVGSPGSGLAYNFDPASGIVSVVTGVASNPTNITFSVTPGAPGTLHLSWPADHLGWILQVQTNSLSQGISTNWVDVPASATITSTNVSINPAIPTEFYRLRLP